MKVRRCFCSLTRLCDTINAVSPPQHNLGEMQLCHRSLLLRVSYPFVGGRLRFHLPWGTSATGSDYGSNSAGGNTGGTGRAAGRTGKPGVGGESGISGSDDFVVASPSVTASSRRYRSESDPQHYVYFQ